MAQYIDGFVLPIKRTKLAAYKRLATKASKVWRDCGALEYRECVADDVDAPGMISFPKLAGAKKGEVVVLAYVVYPSRRHRDAANKKIMKDPRMAAMCAEATKIVSSTRMAFGGFKSLVALRG